MPKKRAAPAAIAMDGLTLAVSDVQRSLHFYRDLLGFHCVMDSGPNFAMVRAGGKSGPTIGLLWLRWAVGKHRRRVTAGMRDGVHLELSTPDLDGTYRRLVARGVRFEGRPQKRAWGERSANAVDPDGYTVELSEEGRGG